MPPKPKSKCCVSKPRCKRCPIRLMAEGRLPDGYTVRKRRLVKASKLKTGKLNKGKKPAMTTFPKAA